MLTLSCMPHAAVALTHAGCSLSLRLSGSRRRSGLVRSPEERIVPLARSDRQRYTNRGAGAGRARECDRSPERVDAILEADHPGPAVGIRATAPVVVDLELDRAVAQATSDRDGRRLRVLDGVRDRLC